MATSFLDIPPEILAKIVIEATLSTVLGPPEVLLNLMLTCRALRDFLDPNNSSEIYNTAFAHRFDTLAPVSRLGHVAVRKNAAVEMRRRFSAIQIFKAKNFTLDDDLMVEVLWTAYLMVEDSDTSQNNIKQLLYAGLPSFLDSYLRRCLSLETSYGWPMLSVRTSLALALLWDLISQSAINQESPEQRIEMSVLLAPIALVGCRYPLFQVCEDLFRFAPEKTFPALPWTPYSARFPPSTFPPQDVFYFGDIKRKIRVPSGPLFAIALYLIRLENNKDIPTHLQGRTRALLDLAGNNGPSIDDIQLYLEDGQSKFADELTLGVGVQLSEESSSNAIIGQPSNYRIGSLSAQWQGPCVNIRSDLYYEWTESLHSRFNRESFVTAVPKQPQFYRLYEHYCCDMAAVVPRDRVENGMSNAWLPKDLTVNVSKENGCAVFSDSRGSFATTYQTYHPGLSYVKPDQVVDVIITGEVADQFVTSAWAAGNIKFLGRVRMFDGLAVLIKNPDNAEIRQLLRCYVTSSGSLVGRLKGAWTTKNRSFYEGVFSLHQNNETPPSL